MIFAPHILEVKKVIPPKNDDFGRPVPGAGGEQWQPVCHCRCDDNTTTEFRSEDGHVYRPSFHIVCAGKHGLKAGDYIRCMDGAAVRGEGVIYLPKRTNYFNYSEVWI